MARFGKDSPNQQQQVCYSRKSPASFDTTTSALGTRQTDIPLEIEKDCDTTEVTFISFRRANTQPRPHTSSSSQWPAGCKSTGISGATQHIDKRCSETSSHLSSSTNRYRQHGTRRKKRSDWQTNSSRLARGIPRLADELRWPFSTCVVPYKHSVTKNSANTV